MGLSTVAMPICARTSSSWRPFSTSFAGSIWIRTAGVTWPPTRTSDTPEIWLMRWARIFSAASSTSMIGATSDRTDRMRNRRVGRVDLPIGRRIRQVFRQLPGGGVDGALNVVGGGVDVAIEFELNGDRGYAERTRRGHLRDARYLGDLALERLRDRGGHGVRGRARQRSRDRDRRKVDLRQRRDGQRRKGDQADQ